MTASTFGLQCDPMKASGNKAILAEVFEKAGGQAALAEKLSAATGDSITRQAVNKWKHIPPKHVRAIAVLTGLPLKRLRPDLFDETLEDLRKRLNPVTA